MTNEEKQLLFIDLCARLPYEVQCEIGGLQHGPYTFTGNDVEDLIAGRMFKPYLRPMSSMTEGEKKELNNVLEFQYYSDDSCMCESTDWLNAHHFDYRNLIEKGLALEAPDGMYKND